jgi:Fe-S-cluster containining protein
MGAVVDEDVNDPAELDAGEFSSWLGRIQVALDGRGESDVPCESCTACCTSAQFVHVEPDEHGTLAHIPRELLFPAPGLPEGHLLLGYDERGHCPMLGDGGCSIYAHRPRACRVYDCRVFAAAGVEIDEAAKAAVAARSRRWRFSFASPEAQVRHEATRAAAAYLEANPPELSGEGRPLGATHRAVAAIGLAELFMGSDPATGAPVVVEPRPGEVAVALDRQRHDHPAPASREREPERGARRTEG